MPLPIEPVLVYAPTRRIAKFPRQKAAENPGFKALGKQGCRVQVPREPNTP